MNCPDIFVFFTPPPRDLVNHSWISTAGRKFTFWLDDSYCYWMIGRINQLHCIIISVIFTFLAFYY